MKLEQLSKDKVKTESELRVNKTATTFRGTQLPIAGLIVWEFDVETGILRKAKIQVNVDLEGNTKKEVTVGKTSICVQALNITNATRKINKYGYQVKSVE